MAVQAQYHPSHVLLLHHNNTSNLQPDYDSSLPNPQILHHHLHQSHTLLTNPGTTKPPKRSTESKQPIGFLNSVSLQSPPQLHNPHQNNVSTGLRLSFSDHHQQQPPPIPLPHHGQTQQQPTHHESKSHYSLLSSLSSQDFASQIKRQRDEIDQFIQAQEAELHRTLAEKRQRHYRELLAAAEETVARRLREKELEVDKVTRINAELEARAAQLTDESQLWQARTKAQEAAAASLQAQLQQAMMNGTALENRDDDALSCAAGAADDAESAYVDPDRVEPAGPKCRGCGQRGASVVVLPCRHLCLCAKCDYHFRACPVCLSFKDSTVQVFLS